MALYEKLDSDCRDEVSDSEDGTVFSPRHKRAWRTPCLTFQTPHTRTPRTRCLLVLACVASMLALFAAAGMLALYPRLAASIHQPSSHSSLEVSEKTTYENHSLIHPILDCGTTRAEAVARGCTLDIMADAWLPQACYNADAAQEALSPNTILAHLGGAGPLDWFLDTNHTQPIPQESLELVDELTAYTWQAYHVAHCIYDWQATVRAMNRVMKGESPVYVHSKLLEEDHIHHCGMVIAANAGEQKGLRGTRVEVHFGLGECVRLDEVVRSKGVPVTSLTD